jgi:hypothetical protein
VDAREERRGARDGVHALRNLIINGADNRIGAGTAGAIKAVVEAMRAHAEGANVREAACTRTDTTDLQRRR